jgi:putative DNA primase/helicase
VTPPSVENPRFTEQKDAFVPSVNSEDYEPESYTRAGTPARDSDDPAILIGLDDVTRTATGWQAKCPAHDDNLASLSVGTGTDGRTLLYCHAGCEVSDIVEAAGVTMSDLFPPTPEPTAYVYTDENGVALYSNVRFYDAAGGKHFTHQLWDEETQSFIPGSIGTVRRVPYRLPELLSRNGTLFLVEGEKDADRLWSLGIAATNLKDWKSDWTDAVRQYATVVVVPDNDPAGRWFAGRAAALLPNADVRLLELPVPDKGDISDWLDAGGTLGELSDLLAAAGPAARELVEDEPEPILLHRQAHDFTDVGNARRLVDLHGQNMRWVVEWKQWIVWDGNKWVLDESAPIELAKDTTLRIYDQADMMRSTGDTDQADALYKWAKQSRSDRAITAMIRLARAVPGVPVSASALDADPWLMVFTNGTVDLRNGNCRESRQEDLLTRSTGFPYNPKAECSSIDAFMSWATVNRPELLAELRRLLGYTMIGTTSERIMLVLHGGGSNGKSTLLKLVRTALGNYAKSLPVATLESQKFSKGGSGASPEIARLKGARFVSSMESEEGMPLSAAKVKELCSDEDIIARQLYQNVVEFTPQHTLWLATNHKPNVPAEDQAVWNRLRLIPFDATVSHDDMDLSLGDKLEREIPGLLAMMVREAVQWSQHGLLRSRATLTATREWREENDTFGAWLNELSDIVELAQSHGVEENIDYRSGPMREQYNARARHEPDWPNLSKAAFKTAMLNHRFTQVRSNFGMIWQWPAHVPVDYAQVYRDAVESGIIDT